MNKNSIKTIETSGSKRIVAAALLASYICAISPVAAFAKESGASARAVERVFAKEEKSEVLISAKKGGTVTLGDASIEIPEGALKKDTKISITRLSKVEDTGESLCNAIPKSGGYRFLPAGTKFEKDVTITLPYSAKFDEKPGSLEDLYTYFFDTKKKSWIKLERLEVDKGRHVVRSLSTHFTDMINATLTMPESASPVDVNLNSIKSLEAAKPDSHLIKFNPPKANNIGDASFSFELAVPCGRRGMQPQVTVNYSSASGNGIMGKGFDINYGSSITTDTRLGLPNYGANDRYMLDGILLSEKSRKENEIIYQAQKEASFNRIVRHGAGTDSDCWEVTDKGGTKRIYAQSPSSCVGGGKKTYSWNLTKTIDVNGNTIVYEYEKDSGYVYPVAILYTGHGSKNGNYSVKFHYDEGGIQRQDVRLDARSKEIVACKKLLTSVTTHYKDGEPIRTYSFVYKEGLAKEKMLAILRVANNAGDSYEYAFDYEQPKKDENGNPIFFDKPVLWKNSYSINESSGKNTGSSVHSSFGGGAGTKYIDGRGSGGVTGGSTSSTNYTKETLIDLDGDGKCENVCLSGSVLRIFRQNSSGSGFDLEPIEIDVSKIDGAGASFLMNKETSSTNSHGWNAYGGIGVAGGLASAGYVRSTVYQNGTAKLHTGFYDMDGDGFVDIVPNTGIYFHNDTAQKGKIDFSLRRITNFPSAATRKIDDTVLTEYRKSYCIQRPFMAWKSVYDGVAKVKSNSPASYSFRVFRKYGDSTIDFCDEFNVGQGRYIYFVPDVGNSPSITELEKERDWSNSVEYKEVKAFGRNFEALEFFPNQTMQDPPNELKNLYMPVYNGTSSGTYPSHYEIKSDFSKCLTSEARGELIKQGLYVPKIMTEDFFKKVKEHVLKKSENISEQENSSESKAEFLANFAGAWTYSISDRLFRLTKKVDRAYFNAYFKDFITPEITQNVMECYAQNGVPADLTEEAPTYKTTAHVAYPPTKRLQNGSPAIGAVYVENGKAFAYIGKLQGKDIIIDIDSMTVKNSNDFEEKIVVREFTNEKCVLSVDDGKYTVSYIFTEITPFADTISEEEFKLIADDFKSLYPNNTLESDVWNLTSPIEKNYLILNLNTAHVTDAIEQDEFINAIFEEKTKFDDATQTEITVYEKKKCDANNKDDFITAELILKNAMYNNIREEVFPYYDSSNSLKSEYASLDIENSSLDCLKKTCLTHKIYRITTSIIEIRYNPSSSYKVIDGKIKILTPRADLTSELTYTEHKLECPSGLSSFNSKNDYSTENLVETQKAMRTLFNETDQTVEVPISEFLYGGVNNWFYGIWTGSESENEFTETKLFAIYNKSSGSAEEYGFSSSTSKSKIEAYGNKKAKAAENNNSQATFSFGSSLPQKNGDMLEGVTSKYIKETVYDDGSVLKSHSETIESKPYVKAVKIFCNRLGGNAYYSIEGVPECAASFEDVLQRTETSGTDTTSGPQASFVTFNNMTSTVNEGSSSMMQSLQDINGDRIPDVLKISGNQCFVYFGKADAMGNIDFPSSPSFLTSSIQALSKNTNKSTSKGFSFSPLGAIIAIYSARSQEEKGINLTNGFGKSEFNGSNSTIATLADLNGDGITDYLNSGTVSLGKGMEYEQNSFSYGWTSSSEGTVSGDSSNISFGGTPPFITENGKPIEDKGSVAQNIQVGFSVSGSVGGCASVSSSAQKRLLMDMNGDGLLDVVKIADAQTESGYCLYEVCYNTGSKIDETSKTLLKIPTWKNISLKTISINNEAVNSNNITVGGSSETLAQTAEIDLGSCSKDIENLDCSVTVSTNIMGNLDFNVNVFIPFWPFSFLGVHLTSNTGGGYNAGTTTVSATVKMTDLDGDGLADHALKISGQGIYWKRNRMGRIGLLRGISLPQGGNIEIDYAEKYGTTDNPNFKYVMSRVTTNDGTDGEGPLPKLEHGEHSVTTLYEYDGGYYDRKIKDFFGFQTVKTIYADGTNTVDEYKNRDYYLKGCLEKSETRTVDGAILSKSATEYCDSPVSLPAKEEAWTYEKSSGESDFIHTSTEYEYDGWGNCIKITQNFGDGQKLLADITYDNTNATDYIIGLPVDIRVYGSDSNLLRRRSGDYDSRGQLKELRQYYGIGNYSRSALKYDSYGNISSVTDGRGATVAYSYDGTENMFVTDIAQSGTDTDTYKSAIKYDIPTQTKKEEIDCNGNSLRYEYDEWQRIKEIWTSYDTGTTPAVSYEYHEPNNDESGQHDLWRAATNNKVTYNADDGSVIQTVLQVDGLGRAVRTAKTGCVNGVDGWNASGAVEYDSKGRTVKEGMTEFISGSIEDLLNLPPKMTELYTSYEYDEKDRQTKTTLPDGSEQFAQFQIEGGNLISNATDPLGNVSTQTTDSRGNIILVAKADKDGKRLTKVTYKYNEMGEMLKAFDAKGHPITAEYDLLGRRTALESLDSGRQEFFYDECSNLVRENNSVLRENNKQIVYKYDGLNRLVRIIYPDTEDTLYVYGGASDARGAAGKILKVTDASGSLEYEYGKLGEVTKETRTLATHLNGESQTETAVMEYRSDYLGRMQWIVYPDGEKITYGYDKGGQVTSVSGEHYGHSFEYVTNILYDQYGQRTRIDYGNGTFTEYSYDPARRWLDTIKTENKWGQAYQNISYSFDAVGNVLGYENDCLDSVTGNYRTKQTYGYDNLYQLIKVEGKTTYNPYRSSAPEFKSSYSQLFDFDSDGLGNMTSKVSTEAVTPQKTIGDNLNYSFNYVYDEKFAHRLTSAGDRHYQYDANGNIICEQDGTFESGGDDDSYHKITQETEDVYSTDYGWGLFKEDDASGLHKKARYRRTYTWNERNQLVSSVDSNYNTGYVYGQDGQRSNKYTQSSETLYFNKMWTRHTDSGNSVYGGQTSKNIYLGETRIVTKLNSGSDPTYHEELYKQYFYHSDHLGSASLISDYKGDEYQRIEYTPYGETWVEKTQNTGLEYLPYKFTAKELDEETGLYYYGARYLDPKYSMWISTDPALGDYIPKAPINEEAKKHNQNLPGMGGVFNHINGDLYAYAGNNPVRYIDPDGRELGMPMEAQKKLQMRAINSHMSFNDFNYLQRCKTGPVDFPITSMLTQRVGGCKKYPDACIYFSAVDAVMMAGYKTDGYFSDLAGLVDSTRGNFTDIVKLVFGLDATYKPLPLGLDEASLKETIGDTPAVLIFGQDVFWENGNINERHGIGYHNGVLFEPYYGIESENIEKIRGSKSSCKLTDYIGGFYFEIQKDE